MSKGWIPLVNDGLVDRWVIGIPNGNYGNWVNERFVRIRRCGIIERPFGSPSTVLLPLDASVLLTITTVVKTWDSPSWWLAISSPSILDVYCAVWGRRKSLPIGCYLLPSLARYSPSGLTANIFDILDEYISFHYCHKRSVIFNLTAAPICPGLSLFCSNQTIDLFRTTSLPNRREVSKHVFVNKNWKQPSCRVN